MFYGEGVCVCKFFLLSFSDFSLKNAETYITKLSSVSNNNKFHNIMGIRTVDDLVNFVAKTAVYGGIAVIIAAFVGGLAIGGTGFAIATRLYYST